MDDYWLAGTIAIASSRATEAHIDDSVGTIGLSSLRSVRGYFQKLSMSLIWQIP